MEESTGLSFSSTTFVKGNRFVMDISVRNEGRYNAEATVPSYFSRRLTDKDENPIVQLPKAYTRATLLFQRVRGSCLKSWTFPRTLDEDLLLITVSGI